MDTSPSTSTAAPVSQTNAPPPKPKIDPLQLLKCLSILLNPRGGIMGRAEVQRVKGLMTKYSKKLVSKCIYLNILQATDLPLLDMFYEQGGWELVGAWLQEAVNGRNWPLATQVLTLMESSPVTLARLKRNATPRMVKELSRDNTATGTQAVAKRLVQKWMEMLKHGDGVAAAAGMGLSSTSPTNLATQPPNMQHNLATLQNSTNNLIQQRVIGTVTTVGAGTLGTINTAGVASTIGTITTTGTPVTIGVINTPTGAIITSANTKGTVNAGIVARGGTQGFTHTSFIATPHGIMSVPVRAKGAAVGLTSTAAIIGSIPTLASTQQSTGATAGTPEPTSASHSTDEGSGGGVSGGGDNSSSQLSQDESSNGSTESEPTAAPIPAPLTTPIRITIRSGSQVLAKVSSQRTSRDSTDSDDNKPLSVLKQEVQHSDQDTCLASPSKQPQLTATHTTTDTTTTTTSTTTQPTTAVPHTVVTFTTGQPTTTVTTTPTQNGPLSSPKSTGKDDKDSESVSETKKAVNGDNKSEKVKVDEVKEDDKVDGKKEKEKKKEHISSKDKDKGRDKDKDRKSRDSDKKDKEKSRSSRDSKDKKDKDKHKYSDSKHRSHHSSSSKDKDKDKDRKDKDRSKSSSSSHKDKKSSRDKEREREKEREKEKEKKDKERRRQETEDKATLEKVKPLSADGLAKIPRRSDPPTFLDALGSADMDVQTPKKATVKTYKSRGFRNTGLLDEPSLPPRKTDKKAASTGGSGVKRSSSLEDGATHPPDKRVKSSVSSQPSSCDKPGGVKLISPKRPSLSDDGGFMAALTAAGSDNRKRVTRKRKSSESDGGKSGDDGAKNGEEGTKSGEEGHDPAVSSPTKTDEKPAILSPTSIRPTFNFYQETLKDDNEDDQKKDGDEKKDEKTTVKTEGIKEEKGEEEGETEVKKESMETSEDEEKMDIDESEDQEKQENGEGASGGGDSANGGGDDDDIPHAPAVPAPAQEDYEPIEVTFSNSPQPSIRPSIIYHRSARRAKKSVKWRQEEDLQQVFYFEMDETERVNVNTIKFNELMVMEKQGEREAMGRRFGGGSMMGGSFGSIATDMDGQRQNCEEFMRWTLLPAMMTGQPTVSPGCKSQEKAIQATRQSSTMPAFFHPSMMPDTPREPDPELITRSEPKEIPLHDVMGQDNIHDHRDKFWPEPLMTDPNIGYGYGGGGGGSSSGGGGGNMGMLGSQGNMGSGPPPVGPPGGSSGASHWVIGAPPMPPYGGPMYGSPGGPGMGGPPPVGPPPGGHGGYGGPGPGNYGQDMGGMDPGPGWGGPGLDCPPGPMMGGGGGNMMMGHHNMGNMGPPNMMPNMGMGGGGGPRYRGGNRGVGNVGGMGGGGGGSGGGWGPRGSPFPCKHFMNGHCRHGKSCKFLHAKPH